MITHKLVNVFYKIILMQYMCNITNVLLYIYISIVIKQTLTGTKNSPYVITIRSVPIHLSNQGIIIIAIVDGRQRIKRIVTKKEDTD